VEGGRQEKVVVRFTAEELAAVSARAAASGLTPSSYLAVVGLRPEGVASADVRSALTNLTGVRRVLAGVASNLNQLTRKVNATGEWDAALPVVVEAVARIAARTEAAVGEVTVLATGGGR
jgi:hypothetical protein